MCVCGCVGVWVCGWVGGCVCVIKLVYAAEDKTRVCFVCELNRHFSHL